MSIQDVIENYENGNLTTAKKEAKKFSLSQLKEAAEEFGKSPDVAASIASYLKGHISFQDVANAEYKTKF